MSYLDSCVVPVRRADLEAYFAVALDMAALWRELGALSVTEGVGDGLGRGGAVSYPRAVRLAEDEVVVVGVITFRNKAHREAVTAAALGDPRMRALMERMPVEGARMIRGGFDIIVSEGSGHG